MSHPPASTQATGIGGKGFAPSRAVLASPSILGSSAALFATLPRCPSLGSRVCAAFGPGHGG